MVLIDNTVLSNFAIIQQPELISHSFTDQVATTEHVFQELEVGIEIGRLPVCNWGWLRKIALTSAEDSRFHQLTAHLGKGEASCLAVAAQRNYKLATDDKDARQRAVRLNIPYTGTLGILAILVRTSQITLTDGNNFLKQMTDSGYYSPLTRLDKLLYWPPA